MIKLIIYFNYTIYKNVEYILFKKRVEKCYL